MTTQRDDEATYNALMDWLYAQERGTRRLINQLRIASAPEHVVSAATVAAASITALCQHVVAAYEAGDLSLDGVDIHEGGNDDR